MSLSFYFPSNLTNTPSLSFSVMGYSWFLNLALTCIDHLAWPLLALGYPLCASVQAIETDSYSETRDLISYWILLSLIYLFEYAFLRLLSWFQFWPYIKLMIVFWLIIPDFRRASYVYSNLVRSFITLNPQVFISRLKNWRKLFVKKENFLVHAEKYIQENGTGALEKLIGSKITAHNAAAEATNTITATDKKETQQTNGKKIQTEHNDIKEVEVIEKKEVSAGKQDIPIMPKPSLDQNISSPMEETNGMAKKDASSGELPQGFPHKEVQKEWACALCQVTTTSEKTLNIHLNGNKHKAKCEALEAKNQPFPEKPKNDHFKVELKQKNTVNQPEKVMLNDPVKHSNSKLRCKACNVTCTSDVDLASHTKGKRHLEQISMMNSSKFRCEACNISCPSVVHLASHFQGKRHLAQIKSFSEEAQLSKVNATDV